MTEIHGGDALDELFWQAEILQAMFWMRGEELAADIDPEYLGQFLDGEPDVVAHHMRRLAEDGYLEPVETFAPVLGDAVRYRLTPLGVKEGGRSFQDEFEDFTKPGHLQCGPGCSCLNPDHAGKPCPVHSH